MREPFQASRAGCGSYTNSPLTAAAPCTTPPVWAGVVFYPRSNPPELWLAFTCDRHRDALDVARPLEERDRDELARRRERWRATVEDKVPWTPEEPLARGVEARERFARAKAWGAGRAPEQQAQTLS